MFFSSDDKKSQFYMEEVFHSKEMSLKKYKIIYQAFGVHTLNKKNNFILQGKNKTTKFLFLQSHSAEM